MNKKNLILILVIDFVIIAGTSYLLRTRYLEYKRSSGSIRREMEQAEKFSEKEKKKESEKEIKEKKQDKQEEADRGSGVRMRNIKFQYVNSKAKIVSIIGDFNDWSPQPLTRANQKVWEITMKLNPGTYKYNYIVDGKVVLDPYNKTPIETSRGFKSSTLNLKPLAEKK